MPPRHPFPDYRPCPAERRIDELKRLLNPDIFHTDYMNARAGGRLVATGLKSFAASLASPRWASSAILAGMAARPSARMNLVFAALFDLVCNAEYIHGRVINKRWIYCNRHRPADDLPGAPYAYYSFLKQCPICCQDRGIEKRLADAQHKPSSHHIGEITTTATAYFLALMGAANRRPLTVGTISKQSHDVDAMAWRDDVLVLFEIKASPLVTYPLRTALDHPFLEDGQDGPAELAQHRLIDVDFQRRGLSLFLANVGVDVPLGSPMTVDWPYPPLTEYIADPDALLTYVEAWADIFRAYSIPKTARAGRDIALGYLANGWGDEIDSNKTKAGLGRTDDIKKGTYQLLKFGAYYRDGSPKLPIRGALVANLDPVFLFDAYMAKLADARWAPGAHFRPSAKPGVTEIDDDALYHLYDMVIAFNRPIYNDPLSGALFNFQDTEAALLSGALDPLLRSWGARC
jgi:hypothetical protein